MSAVDELHTALERYKVSGASATSSAPGPPPKAPSFSRWTPSRIREAIATIPAASVYPELVARAADILEGWYHRFPLTIWNRFVRFADSGTGRRQQLPKVLKEFNEAAPVLARLLEWVEESRQAGQPPMAILDLGSGFGFLAMFASELLPREQVERIYLIDKAWPNRSVPGSVGDGISTSHIYEHGSWPIPLLTLQINMKNSREMRGVGHHIIRDPQPTIICGIHLCGTLSLRAIQLFNEGLLSGCGVTGFIMAPCCLPRRQHRERKFFYEVGGHRFGAEELHDKAANPGMNAFEVYQKHLMQCIQAEEKTSETMQSLDDAVHQRDGPIDKNVFFFARAPFNHIGAAAGKGIDFGKPVVVEGANLDYGPSAGLPAPTVAAAA